MIEATATLFEQMVGEWSGTTAIDFGEAGGVVTDQANGTISLLTCGKSVIHRYRGSFKGDPIEGFAIYSFCKGKRQFEMAWVDSFHHSDGIMYATGAATEGDGAGTVFTVLGSYQADFGDGSGPQEFGWRTAIEMPSADAIKITMTNVFPDGSHHGGVVTEYSRSQ